MNFPLMINKVIRIRIRVRVRVCVRVRVRIRIREMFLKEIY